MPFTLTDPQPADRLSLTELALYHLIMDYRSAEGLDPIPLSVNLTATAGRHAADTLYNIWGTGMVLPEGANLHSWSDAPYYGDHRDPSVMWYAPDRIGIDYPSHAFEISAAGYGSIAGALAGWQGSSGHDTVIVNEGAWANLDWNAIGIGVEFDPAIGTYGGRIFHVWFGTTPDPDGAGRIRGTGEADTIAGTAFDDSIAARGGSDSIAGGNGHDVIRAGGGRDSVSGEAGRDRLFGQGGRDDLQGGAGRDRIEGGAGNDTLSGGGARDLFVFRGDFGRDRLTDYDDDRIRIVGPDEASTRAALRDALSDRNGNAVYDHGGDGQNVIVFEGISADDLDLSLFMLA